MYEILLLSAIAVFGILYSMGHSFYNKLKDKNGSIDFTKIH